MRRILLVMAVAAFMVAMMATAVPAFAQVGDPNANACLGQINSTLNTQWGTNPKEATDFFNEIGIPIDNPGALEQQDRAGDFGAFDKEAGQPIFCPRTP
jgi:hypothetical protein